MERLGIPIDPRWRVRNGMDKYAWYDVPGFRSEATPLAAVYHMTRSPETADKIPRPLFGSDVVKILSRCVYRLNIGMTLGKEVLIMKTLMEVLDSVPVFCMSHNPGEGRDSVLPDQLLAHWHSLVLHELTP
jgi:hypothetical protein